MKLRAGNVIRRVEAGKTGRDHDAGTGRTDQTSWKSGERKAVQRAARGNTGSGQSANPEVIGAVKQGAISRPTKRPQRRGRSKAVEPFRLIKLGDAAHVGGRRIGDS
jgi:hypothetical protein